VIILPWYYDTILTSTFATVSTDAPSYEAIHGRMPLHEFGNAIGVRHWVNSEMHWEAAIERVWRCTLWPWSSQFGDAIQDWDWVNSEMHWEAVIERVWRCAGRPWSSEFGDALWGCDRARLEMQLETEIEWTQRCTPSYDRASLVMHLQQAMIEGD